MINIYTPVIIHIDTFLDKAKVTTETGKKPRSLVVNKLISHDIHT